MTVAWGVNLPAHLVIVKGTEYFDGKLKRYVDYPVTDILQMMGRAGRPQFDKEGVAVVMCEESKKNFLKKVRKEVRFSQMLGCHPILIQNLLLSFYTSHFPWNHVLRVGCVKS